MGVIISDSYTSEKEIQLTLNSDSVQFSDGQILYYIRRSHREIRLIDAYHKSLLTLRPKVPSLRRRWEGFSGGSKPIFSVRRSSMIGSSNLSAEVYGDTVVGKFRIKGSFEKRRFRVDDIANRSVGAEIRRVVGGEEASLLCVTPTFDSAFAVGLALVFEQIGGGGGGGPLVF